MKDSLSSSEPSIEIVLDFLELPPKEVFCLPSGLPAQRLQELTQEQQNTAEIFSEEAILNLESLVSLLASQPLQLSQYLPHDGTPQTSGAKLLIEVRQH